MGNQSLIRVNQKINHARLMCQQASSKGYTSVQLSGFLEGAAFHLKCAYLHYLREMAETYGLKSSANIQTEYDLAKAFDLAQKTPAELHEWQALREDKSSWFSIFEHCEQALWQTPVLSLEGASVHVEPSDNYILTIDVTDTEIKKGEVESLSVAEMCRWIDSFVEIITRQRQTMTEF